MSKYDDHPRPAVPLLPEEAIAAAIQKRRGDPEKVATTSLYSVTWWGITIQSRYSKADELELMLDMAQGVRPSLRGRIAKIFCDSKAGCSFEVLLIRSTQDQIEQIGRELEAVCIGKVGGHNGMWLDGGYKHTVHPNWPSFWSGGDLPDAPLSEEDLPF
jgi:hypothetical protein